MYQCCELWAEVLAGFIPFFLQAYKWKKKRNFFFLLEALRNIFAVPTEWTGWIRSYSTSIYDYWKYSIYAICTRNCPHAMLLPPQFPFSQFGLFGIIWTETNNANCALFLHTEHILWVCVCLGNSCIFLSSFFRLFIFVLKTFQCSAQMK